VIDILIISGGGDWGAFGAGFPQGVQKVPAGAPAGQARVDAVDRGEHRHADRPVAIPLATNRRSTRIVNLYRNPEADWVKAARGPVLLLPGQHFVRRGTRELEREMRKQSLLAHASSHLEGGRRWPGAGGQHDGP